MCATETANNPTSKPELGHNNANPLGAKAAEGKEARGKAERGRKAAGPAQKGPRKGAGGKPNTTTKQQQTSTLR